MEKKEGEKCHEEEVEGPKAKVEEEEKRGIKAIEKGIKEGRDNV